MSGIIGGSRSKSGVIDLINAGEFDQFQTAKAWLKMTRSGNTPTIVNSYNVSGIASFVYSRWRVTWVTPFPDTNYVIVGSAGEGEGGAMGISGYATTYADIYMTTHGPTVSSPVSMAFVVFGD